MIEPGRSSLSASATLAALEKGDVMVEGLMPECSNYTFLARVTHAGGEVLAVYKPQRGETPLHDFPSGTLCLRERAAYLVSMALGWDIVPATVMRAEAPLGLGSLQLFVEADLREHYFTLAARRRDVFERFAAFDCVINNADRKAGHCLLDGDGHVWGVDQGLSFHALPKLRTVIWDYAGDPVPPPLLANVAALAESLTTTEAWVTELRTLLHPREVEALGERARALVRAGVFPHPRSDRSFPWPPI
jgi:uncharacterized repeat protein (TIGR03843 family)